MNFEELKRLIILTLKLLNSINPSKNFVFGLIRWKFAHLFIKY